MNCTTPPWDPSKLDVYPRLGWAEQPSPVTQLKELTPNIQIKWIGCKRDDLCTPLYGGSKVRKLDFLLATDFFKHAEGWASAGAIGSGHLLTCALAARTLGKKFHAYIFWEPISKDVIQNLGWTALKSDQLFYFPSRISLGAGCPRLFLCKTIKGMSVVPMGATCAYGMLGMVRAGLELANQVRSGELPEPHRIYLPLGTGGTTAGLAVGLALRGLSSRIHAVAVVEHIFSTRWRIKILIQQICKILRHAGLISANQLKPAPIYIDRSQLGKGYGITTAASQEAVECFRKSGIHLEEIYTGKAAAAMLTDLRRSQNENILLWNTKHGNFTCI